MIAVTDRCDIGIRALERVAAPIPALPTSSDRKRSSRSAGCSVAIPATQVLKGPDAKARVIERLMTGASRIGGGAGLEPGRERRGRATAASFRATVAVGSVVGYRLRGIALVISVAAFLGPGKAIQTRSCRSPP